MTDDEIYEVAVRQAVVDGDLVFEDLMYALAQKEWVQILNDEISTLYDHENLFRKYFGSPIFLKESVEQEIRLTQRVSRQDKQLKDLMQQIETQFQSPHVTFRLVLCSLIHRNPDENGNINNQLTIGETLQILFTGIFSNSFMYGFNHVALQVGGWLFHYVDNGFPLIQPISSSNSCAMIYLNNEGHISRDKLPLLCAKVSEWATHDYRLLTANCHKFVEDVINGVECKKTWIKDGPIEKFLVLVQTSKCRVHHIQFYDPFQKKVVDIRSYEMLKQYWTAVLSQNEIYSSQPEFHEFKEVIKCIERGYQLANNNEERHHANPLFPASPGFCVGITGAFLI